MTLLKEVRNPAQCRLVFHYYVNKYALDETVKRKSELCATHTVSSWPEISIIFKRFQAVEISNNKEKNTHRDCYTTNLLCRSALLAEFDHTTQTQCLIKPGIVTISIVHFRLE